MKYLIIAVVGLCLMASPAIAAPVCCQNGSCKVTANHLCKCCPGCECGAQCKCHRGIKCSKRCKCVLKRVFKRHCCK